MRPSTLLRARTTTVPFALPLHVGTDICSIARVERLLRKYPARLVQRVLTPREVVSLPAAKTLADLGDAPTGPDVVSYLLKNTDGGRTGTSGTVPLRRGATYLAGRFAAKEAAIKAHPHFPGLTLQSVRIDRTGSGKGGSGPPVAFVTVPASVDHQADTDVEQEARISISHDGDYATAVCIGFDASH